MEFCDECGSMMLPSKIDGKMVFKCKCGAIKMFDEDKSTAYKELNILFVKKLPILVK